MSKKHIDKLDELDTKYYKRWSIFTLNSDNTKILFDFHNQESVNDWYPINDNVMGGVSDSVMIWQPPDHAVFQGHVSLENNGGFASVRTHEQDHDLSKYTGLVLFVRGDGQQYKLNLKTEATFDTIQYQVAFDTKKDEWMEIKLPFSEFKPTFRGRDVPKAEPLNPAEIKTFGFMISDKQAGPFQLAIDFIAAYLE